VGFMNYLSNKKAKSTYEEFIEDPEQKALLDKEYKKLLMSELLSAAMREDHISVENWLKLRVYP